MSATKIIKSTVKAMSLAVLAYLLGVSAWIVGIWFGLGLTVLAVALITLRK